MKKGGIGKRKSNNSFKGIFDRLLESLFESVEDNTEDLLKKLGDFAFIKSTLKKHIIFFMFSFTGLVLSFMGIGLMISDFFPNIQTWMAYIVLGIILYIIGLVYRNLK